MTEESENTGVTRSQNQLHVLPPDWSSAHALIAPLLERVDASAGVQLLVVTADAEAAIGIGVPVARDASARGLRVLTATDGRRAVRAQRANAPHVVIAPATVLRELVSAATLKLDAIRVVIFAWLEGTDAGAVAALETVVAELPKDAARFMLASEVTPVVEELVERYARRARRIPAATPGTQAPVSLSYVVAAAEAKAHAVRRLIDEVDPASTFVLAHETGIRDAIVSTVTAMGYGPESTLVRVGDSLPTPPPELVILAELPSPATEETLRGLVAAAGTGRVVAVVSARQLTALRRLAGGSISPFVLPDAAVRARSRLASLRDELRNVLQAGQPSGELLAIEPLLEEYDGAEIAAAALKLLDQERTKVQTGIAKPDTGAVTRLYINVGTMDNVRPGDLVGAITNEGGISKAELGKVDVRERHSTVEVATQVANQIVSKLNGVTIRGRRALVKVDEDRAAGGGGARGGAGGGPRGRRDDARPGGRGGARDRDGGRGRRERTGPPRDRDRFAGRSERPRDDRPRSEETRPEAPREDQPDAGSTPSGENTEA